MINQYKQPHPPLYLENIKTIRRINQKNKYSCPFIILIGGKMSETLSLSALLTHYKRKDVQEAIICHAKDKEIAVKFGEKGFGKRPDTLQYTNDILELAKQGATSFHASEELWKNPLQLDPLMKRQELEDLRIGWDLIIDIDCIVFDYSKIAADLVIKALKFHKIKSIS